MTSVLLKRVGRLWMTSAWLCALCVVVGDQPRLCTRRGWRGRSATKLPTGISTSRAVTGGLAVAKVFLAFVVPELALSAWIAAECGW